MPIVLRQGIARHFWVRFSYIYIRITRGCICPKSWNPNVLRKLLSSYQKIYDCLVTMYLLRTICIYMSSLTNALHVPSQMDSSLVPHPTEPPRSCIVVLHLGLRSCLVPQDRPLPKLDEVCEGDRCVRPLRCPSPVDRPEVAPESGGKPREFGRFLF